MGITWRIVPQRPLNETEKQHAREYAAILKDPAVERLLRYKTAKSVTSYKWVLRRFLEWTKTEKSLAEKTQHIEVLKTELSKQKERDTEIEEIRKELRRQREKLEKLAKE